MNALLATACHVPPAPAAGWSQWDWFTNFGAYMPRVECLRTADGSPDWGWIVALIVLTAAVAAGYLRVFVFWIRAYRSERPPDRNPKLMQLARVFVWCAICGYLLSILMFFWPAYRIQAFALVVLNFWLWRFCTGLSEFRSSFSAHRLQRELHTALKQRNEELERLVTERTREFARARAAADAANAAKGDFLTRMSHEMRTPLTAILGFADLLIDDPATRTEQRALASDIRRSGDHLLALVSDILDLSRIESGRLRVESAPYSPGQILSDVVCLTRCRAAERGLDLDYECPEPLPEALLGDGFRLRQIVLNLVDNAIKFTPNGVVTIRAEVVAGPNGSRLRVDVCDTGIGISPDEAERLFEPFAQGDESMARCHGGSGLGLAMSRKLARAMGGDVVLLESAPHAGSRFRVELPAVSVAPGPIQQTETPNAERRFVPTTPREPLNCRVLLAEDGPDNRRLIARLVQSLGASIETVDNGLAAREAALEALRSGVPFDVVLMDMQMPIMDGYEATRQLRAAGYAGAIIAVTAHAMPEDREICIRAGCTDYITKPIDRAALAAALKRASETSANGGGYPPESAISSASSKPETTGSPPRVAAPP